jgi:hypothetical protein
MTSPESQDIARRGLSLYETRLRSLLEPQHLEEYVSIEPDSGDYFLGKTL